MQKRPRGISCGICNVLEVGRLKDSGFGVEKTKNQAKKVKKHKKAFEAEVDELDERQKHDIGLRGRLRQNSGDVDGGMDP